MSIGRVKDYILNRIDEEYRIKNASIVLLGGSYDSIIWSKLDPYFLATGMHTHSQILWDHKSFDFSRMTAKTIILVHVQNSENHQVVLPAGSRVYHLYDWIKDINTTFSIFRLPDEQLYYSDMFSEEEIPAILQPHIYYCNNMIHIINENISDVTNNAKQFMRYAYSFGVEEAVMVSRDVSEPPKHVDKWLQNYSILKSPHFIWPSQDKIKLPAHLEHLFMWYSSYMNSHGTVRCLVDSLLVNAGWNANNFRLRLYYFYYYGYQNRKDDEVVDEAVLSSIQELHHYHRWTDRTLCRLPKSYMGMETIMRVLPIVLFFYNMIGTNVSMKQYIIKISIDQSFTTHNNRFIAELCGLVAFAFLHFMENEHSCSSIEELVSYYNGIMSFNLRNWQDLEEFPLYMVSIDELLSDLRKLSTKSKVIVQDDFKSLLYLYQGIYNLKVLFEPNEYEFTPFLIDAVNVPISVKWDHCWLPTNRNPDLEFDCKSSLFRINVCSARLKEVNCRKSLPLTVSKYQGKHHLYQMQNKEMLFYKQPLNLKKYPRLKPLMDAGFEVFSAGKLKCKCGRFVTRIVQGVLTGEMIDNRSLEDQWYNAVRTSVIQLIDRVQKFDTVNSMKIDPGVYESSMNLIDTLQLNELMKVDKDKFLQNLWNTIDLRIGMNLVGLRVGLICLVVSENRHKKQEWTSVVSYDFDKYFQDGLYDHFVIGLLMDSHWHFLAHDNCIIFTKQIFKVLNSIDHRWRVAMYNGTFHNVTNQTFQEYQNEILIEKEEEDANEKFMKKIAKKDKKKVVKKKQK